MRVERTIPYLYAFLISVLLLFVWDNIKKQTPNPLNEALYIIVFYSGEMKIDALPRIIRPGLYLKYAL